MTRNTKFKVGDTIRITTPDFWHERTLRRNDICRVVEVAEDVFIFPYRIRLLNRTCKNSCNNRFDTAILDEEAEKVDEKEAFLWLI